MTSEWFPHSKAYKKRAEIARLIREETGRLLIFNEEQRRKRPAPDSSVAQAKPPKLIKLDSRVTVTTAVDKPDSVLVKASNLDISKLKVAELKVELTARQ